MTGKFHPEPLSATAPRLSQRRYLISRSRGNNLSAHLSCCNSTVNFYFPDFGFVLVQFLNQCLLPRSSENPRAFEQKTCHAW